MFGGQLTAILSALVLADLAVSQDRQDIDNGRRRVSSFDEDTISYDYDYGNSLQLGGVPESLPPAPVPPRRRVVQPPRNQYTQLGNRGGPSGLVGKDACSKGATGSVAHETSCDLYYDCYDGQAFLQTCENGLVYSASNFGLVGPCDYPHNVNCQGKERNPPQSTEHCDWLYGIFGHETSCTRYWTCWNGTATEQFCIGGLLYNEETHACDWPQNVAGCQKHPLCKDDANGNVPLGKSCNRYWACQGGYPRLQRCPAMLVFDKNRRRCVTPPTEDCEVPTTVEPPTDESQNDNGSGPRSPNPRRGGGGGQQSRRNNRPPPAQPIPLDGPSDQLPFNLPPGAVPLN